ncbi:MAG TPA: protein kinase, partial [Kofleriaceae bacterium]|nr:protein kinase [Kofleriaceae bacterium]
MAQVTGNASRHLGIIVYSLDPVTNTTSPTERVGRYQLLEPIGIGPSGTVSRAKVFGVAGFERQFAVKRFHTELTATAAMAAMMSAAARAYGSLEHPRIARMSEFGVAQGATFTAVEYVVGLDALRLIGEARLAGVTLAAGGALALVSQAARAVGYAHGRGLTHLGLAPTNVIVTADGDIKITDFGILSATLPTRPIEVPRLAQRIPYLAPEQLANEATSAATDVFALGVLAHELVTGTRTFKGDTPQQVASAIMAGPPAEPPLPRPIVRVLSRCLARSPFERFPDARALADALDAALRVAPVPGTRRDIGAQVKETLDRLAALNEGQMSGVVALHLGTGPVRRIDDDRAAGDTQQGPPRMRGDSLPYEIGRPEVPLGGPPTSPSAPPTLAGGPATTLPDLPRAPMTTVTGLAPPPIPVPQGMDGPPTTPSAPPAIASTMPGMGKSPPAVPSIKRPGAPTGQPARPPALPGGGTRPSNVTSNRPGTDLAIPIEARPANLPPVSSSESAIHALDSSDLMTFDAGGTESVDLDAIDDNVPPEHDAADDAADDETQLAPASAAGPSSESATGRPAAASGAARDGATPPAAASASGARHPYRLDPSAIDTKPILPVVLEPLLFDPINRRDDAPGEARTERATERAADRVSERSSDRPGASTAAPGDRAIDRSIERPGDRPSDRSTAPPPERPPLAGLDDDTVTIGHTNGAGASSPAAADQDGGPPSFASQDARFGKTILGFASPPRLPTPPLGSDRPRPAPADPIAEMAHEGFRTADPDQPPGEPAAPEPGVDGPPPPMMTPPAATPVAPAPTMPSGWTSPPPPEGPAAPAGSPDSRRRATWLIVAVVGVVFAGVGAWQIYARTARGPSGPTGGRARIASAPGDARIALAPADATRIAAAPPDAAAGTTAVAARDAGTAAVAASPVDAPPATRA